MAKKAASRAMTPEVIDVQPENPEVALLRSEANPIQSFLVGMANFLTTARDLENTARVELEAAKAWKQPTTVEEDERLTAFIRKNTADKKEMEEHWKITTLMHQFHRRLTAGRDRGVKVRDEVALIGNRLHNAYTEAERRRVNEENDRRRREQERLANEQRERELRDLEAKALSAEAGSPDLSEREQRFIDYYLSTKNAPQAARQAGYKEPDSQALRLLNSEKIKAAVAAKQQATEIRQQVAARREQPVEVSDFVEVKAQVAGGDRTTWGAQIYDEDAFISACMDPMTRTRHGIPADIVVAAMKRAIKLGNGSLPEVNDIATQIHEKIDTWPGVRHKKNTRVV